ncbi:glycoside hydrolase family protein [Venturia nashicola]|nr:glycoside hydrolase family protein [Venturia nashicola]
MGLWRKRLDAAFPDSPGVHFPDSPGVHFPDSPGGHVRTLAVHEPRNESTLIEKAMVTIGSVLLCLIILFRLDSIIATMVKWNIWSAAALPAVASGIHLLDLSTANWTVSNGRNVTVAGSLPSVVHLDLFAAKVIEDPYYGLNDFNLRWITQDNWTYSAPITGLQGDAKSTWLLFNGLDTFTSIDLCGKHVAATNNQFRQYWFDVSGVLEECPGQKVLSINFGSVPKIVDGIAALPGQETWPFGVEGLFEYPNRQFARKEQSDFGWDWGPAFVPVGPWLPAYVVQMGPSDVYIRNSLVDIYRKGQLPLTPPDQTQPWILNTSLDVFGPLSPGASIHFDLSDSKNSTIASGRMGSITTGEGVVTGFTTIPADAVELWWPTGLGPQTLYTLKLSVLQNDGVYPITTTTKRVGFRTIVLNEEPIRLDQLAKGVAPGNNWHFEINGHEFYAKGSNFIPPDAFWPRVTAEKVRMLFDAVVAGNQNMLRVWASEMGILLWSEFEFGDALYPVDVEFLSNVKQEANYQVRRVNHHPSLALWAGGNELENLELEVAKEAAPEQFEKYRAEYEKLFLDVLVPCVFENSRSISYAPSSTSNGWLSLNFSLPQPITERYNNKTPGSIYGETDYYNYNSAFAFSYSSYPIGRFSNEFGYHSMPSLQSWQQAIAPEDLHFNSSTIQLRNHHYPSGGLNTSNYANSTKGMAEMTIAAQRWYPTPNKQDSIANFSSWCQITQIFQADFYRSQIMFYRRGSGKRERQLGSLYWQLEDIWQAPTWAGIEYDGRWKVLHHIAADIYKNVIISPFHDLMTGDLEVWVTSDLWSPTNGTAKISWYTWAGKLLNISTPSTVDFAIGAINSTQILKTNTFDILKAYDPKDVVLHVSLTSTGNLPNNATLQTYTHEQFLSPVPLSTAHLVDPGLQVSFDKARRTWTVEATKGIAAWVWLDYPIGLVGHFEDNGFWLSPGVKREIGFVVKSGGYGDDQWTEKVKVESLWNMTLP